MLYINPIKGYNFLDTVTVPLYKTPNSRIAPEIQTRRESRGFSAFWGHAEKEICMPNL